MFDEEYLDSLPSDPEQAAYEMSGRFLEYYSIIPVDSELDSYDRIVEAFAAMETLIEVAGLPFTLLSLGEDRKQNIEAIFTSVSRIHQQLDKKVVKLAHSRARDKFRARFGVVFAYEFSDGDLKRVQELINELREAIIISEVFDAKHKQRILQRLEALQGELHKKMSSLDRLWGLVGEAGVVLGKFGKDAKPFVDRIKEIAQITWRTQARAEELPSGTPLPLLASGRDVSDQQQT